MSCGRGNCFIRERNNCDVMGNHETKETENSEVRRKNHMGTEGGKRLNVTLDKGEIVRGGLGIF